MTDSIIHEFVAEQRELLDLELQSEGEAGIIRPQNNDERSAHILGNLETTDVSVGLYGRAVVQLQVWAEKSSEKEPLLPAHRFTVGDEVEIRPKHHTSKKQNPPGGVISAVCDTSISIALFQNNSQKAKNKSTDTKGREDDDDDNDDGLGVPPLTIVPRSSVEVHRKMLLALETLDKKCVDHPIAGRIIHAMFHADDMPPAVKLPIKQPFNSNLDESQLDAISFALQDDRPISLIHGPPGTGKTTTVAELIHQAVHVYGKKVLVTAPSNVAVDNILERLVSSSSPRQKSKGDRKAPKNKSLRAVRLGHPARIKSSILSYSLEALVQNADGTEIVADVRSELQSFLRILSNPKSRPNDKRTAYREMKSLRKEVRTREEKVVRELISSAQVVLATCVGSANRILDKVENGFDLVVIDEAAQALEASCWIPILRGRKVVLAGDHCQLPPTIKTRHHRAQVGLGKTMFERLMELYGDRHHKSNAIPKISRMLKVQYRMHQDIADWASKAMYEGELTTHESVKDRTLGQLDSVNKVPLEEEDGVVSLKETTLLLLDTAGCDFHETVNEAGSRFNEGEANIVNQHVRKLIGVGLQQNQIAIITPYNGQVELLRSLLLLDFPKLEIRSVDGFQGGERDAVVLSLVRSSERGGKEGIGFLRDDRRQNVAVTRAKRHLAVICDSETVSQSKFIRTLILWIEEHGEQRSAIEYLSESPDNQYADDLRIAEAELLKMAENSFSGAEKQKASPSNQVKVFKAKARKLDEIKRKALMDKLSTFSEQGQKGEEMALSSELSSFDRRLVHEFAEQIGLEHRSEGVEGVDRKIILTIKKKEGVEVPQIAQSFQTKHETEEAVKISVAPVVSPFTALAADESDSDDSTHEASTPVGSKESTESDSAQTSSSLLVDLARERRERQMQQEAPTPASNKTAAKKKKKVKGRKLGGNKKDESKEEENLDHLDDMAFLDAQVEKAQTAHGRKVVGPGKGYRTIVNGILNATPETRVAPKNARASASLKSKLQDAHNSRKGKSGKKKK